MKLIQKHLKRYLTKPPQASKLRFYLFFLFVWGVEGVGGLKLLCQNKFTSLLHLFLSVTIPILPSLLTSIWFGQYLNTTTNYPIIGLCPYHFGLIDIWPKGWSTLWILMCHWLWKPQGTNLFVLVNISSWSGTLNNLSRRWWVVSQINQSFLPVPNHFGLEQCPTETKKIGSRINFWLLHFPTILEVSQNQYLHADCTRNLDLRK